MSVRIKGDLGVWTGEMCQMKPSPAHTRARLPRVVNRQRQAQA